MPSSSRRKIKVVALAASPRVWGNSDILLKESLAGLSDKAITQFVKIPRISIAPCSSCGYCLTHNGECKIKDEFQDVARLLDGADILVVSSPIYFYGLPAQFKSLIDRSQSRWALNSKTLNRNLALYHHAPRRPAYTILVGATRGKKLFEGALLTLKYFYDVWGFHPAAFLLVRGVDEKGEIKNHPRALSLARKFLQRRVTLPRRNQPEIITYET